MAASTGCCIAGGGPAGMVLGYLLARAGIDVTVLEKHDDFLRDFRGDTLHPSTLEVMAELGLDADLLELPNIRVDRMRAVVGGRDITVADFRRLPVRHRFIALMPQWDFLNFLAERAGAFPGFHLRMNTEAVDLLIEDGAVVGLRALADGTETALRTTLVVGADGRNSVLRAKADLPRVELAAPVDVVWFRVSRSPAEPDQPFLRIDGGRVLVTLNRGNHWQCGYVIPKGALGRLHAGGLDAFRQDLALAAPFLADRLEELDDWDAMPLLSVRVDRLRRWYLPGLLFIGDAAHAMSPIGGVGINLAVQDAVAAANILTQPLRAGRVREPDLRQLQRRREWPTRATQWAQVQLQERGLRPATDGNSVRPPLAANLLAALTRLPVDQRANGRLIGLGVRPEHVQAR